MTFEELTSQLKAILAEEGREEVRWPVVEAMCDDVVQRLNTEVEPSYPHDIVYHFLEDADARRKSPKYAESQRIRLVKWLDGSTA